MNAKELVFSPTEKVRVKYMSLNWLLQPAQKKLYYFVTAIAWIRLAFFRNVLIKKYMSWSIRLTRM